jgi:uncharacterized membrane protein
LNPDAGADVEREGVAAGDGLSPVARVAIVAGLAHLCWATYVGISHPGLGYEPDLVANWLYFQRWLAHGHSLAHLWYFPAPKLLLVFLLGPFADTAGVPLIGASAAALLAGCLVFIVGLAGGTAAGVGMALLLAVDPSWNALVAISSGDMYLAAAVAGAIVAWTVRRERLAALAILLATLVKPLGAAAALPLLLDRAHSLKERIELAVAAALGLVMTLVGYIGVLGSSAEPNRFLTAFTTILGGADPTGAWLYSYLSHSIGSDLLAHGWPLAMVGLGALAFSPGARALRQLTAAALSVAGSFALLAAITHTALAPRFFWLVELTAVALAVSGVFAIVRWLGAVRQGLAYAAAAAALLLVGNDLNTSRQRAVARYSEPFERGFRATVPLLDELRVRLAPDDHVNVPLWMQPVTIWRLGLGANPERVEAAESAAARQLSPSNESGSGTTWVLFTPDYYETDAGAKWMASRVHCGYRLIDSVDLPAFLVRKDRSVRCAESDGGSDQAPPAPVS